MIYTKTLRFTFGTRVLSSCGMLGRCWISRYLCIWGKRYWVSFSNTIYFDGTWRSREDCSGTGTGIAAHLSEGTMVNIRWLLIVCVYVSMRWLMLKLNIRYLDDYCPIGAYSKVGSNFGISSDAALSRMWSNMNIALLMIESTCRYLKWTRKQVNISIR